MWRLLIANHPDRSLWSTNQKYWAAVRSNLLHSFLEVHNCVALRFHRPWQVGAEKPISWAKPAHLDFLTINCTVWSHILSTGGDLFLNYKFVLSLFLIILGTYQLQNRNIGDLTGWCVLFWTKLKNFLGVIGIAHSGTSRRSWVQTHSCEAETPARPLCQWAWPGGGNDLLLGWACC